MSQHLPSEATSSGRKAHPEARSGAQPGRDASTQVQGRLSGRARHPRRASLLLVGEVSVGAALREGVPLVVGRAPPADLVMADRSLSRQHARLTWAGDRLLVEDLDSTNGVFVDGKRVAQARFAPGGQAGAGAEVWLGSVQLIAHAARPAAGPSPTSTAARRATQSAALSAPTGLEDAAEGFRRRVQAELVRSQTFGRPFALLALRRDTPPEAGWERQLLPVLRPVDGLAAVGQAVCLIALPEVPRSQVAEWAARFERALFAPDLHVGAALVPALGGAATPEKVGPGREAHAAEADALIAAALDALADSGTGTAGIAFATEAPAGSATAKAQTPHAASATESNAGSAADHPIVESPAMRSLFDVLARMARTPLPVLAQGETGSGKEIVARWVHAQSPRAEQTFRAVNCATIPAHLTESMLFGHERGAFTGASSRSPGLFEQADGGTVFLDEVGELAPQAQAALLRVLETRTLHRVGGTREIAVDVRVVAATHRDLEAMVAAGTFREDLLYRLDALAVRVPPLRERPEDVLPLARFFLERVLAQWDMPRITLSAPVLAAFIAYRWPGNVRQLKNVVERAVAIATGPEVSLADLPPDVAAAADERPDLAGLPESDAPPDVEPRAASPLRGASPLTERIAAFEKHLIQQAHQACGGNQTRTAEVLGIPRRTLAHKVKRYGIE